MNKDILIALLVSVIFIMLLTMIFTPSTTGVYENGVKCGLAYAFNEGQKDVNFIIKNYKISDSCAYIVEQKIQYRGIR